jgi:urease accessory protein
MNREGGDKPGHDRLVMAAMHRVASIRHYGEWDTLSAIDRVVLDAGDRARRRIVLTGENGSEFLLDFEKPVNLRDGDGLVLDDGSIVLVAGAREALAEISTHSPRDFVRLAWHLGNRHTELQIVGDRLRVRRDHVLEEMLRGLGAHLAPLEAPFDPEPSGPGNEHGR